MWRQQASEGPILIPSLATWVTLSKFLNVTGPSPLLCKIVMRVLTADGHEGEVNVCEEKGPVDAPLHPYYRLIQLD